MVSNLSKHPRRRNHKTTPPVVLFSRQLDRNVLSVKLNEIGPMSPRRRTPAVWRFSLADALLVDCMANTEAEDLGKLAIRLGIVSESQLADVLDDMSPLAPPDELVDTLVRKGILTGFQADKLRKGDTDGYFLGGYRLLYKIASGSFGRVYRADDPRTGAAVAVKVLRRRWTEDANKINLFEREG